MFRNVLTLATRTAVRSSAVLGAKRATTLVVSRSASTQSRAAEKRVNLFLLGGTTVALTGLALANVPMTNAAAPATDYKLVRERIAKIIEDEPSHGPLFVRLAWHSSGTFDKVSKTGGSNGGTMRFKPESEDGANKGLHIARNLLEPIKKEFPELSYGDLWTLAGVVAIEEMRGPVVKWRPGRKDVDTAEKVPPNGRLPDADKGSSEKTASHVRDVFYRMGFNDREIVALLGAHALGRCHPDRSGYSGPWTRSEITFSNEYFRELVENKWTEKKWSGPKQYEDPTGQLMMLPADLVLIQDPQFKKFVEMYAKDENLFFKDFAKAFQKLEELGVDFPSSGWFSWLWGK